jgi:hypothetical protein
VEAPRRFVGSSHHRLLAPRRRGRRRQQLWQHARVTGDPWTCNCATNIYRNNKFFSAGGEVNWDLGFANLTYLTGYNFSRLDRSGENAATGAPNYFKGKDFTWSHELRLGGKTGDLTWVAACTASPRTTMSTSGCSWRPTRTCRSSSLR